MGEQVRYDVTPIEAQACLSKSFISPVFEGVLSLPPPSPSNEANALQWWHQWVFTQRFWLLVLQNPQLEGLRLGKNFSSLRLGLQDGLILKTLTSLRNLTRLDTYFLGEGFDFRAVLEELPQVKHLAVGVENLSVPRSHRSFSHIQTMHISASLELLHLLLLIDYIPNLDQLWIQGFHQPWKSDEYTSQTCISVGHLRELYITSEPLPSLKEMNIPLADHVLSRLWNLESLSMRVLSQETAVALGKYCPKLQSFQIVNYDHSIHPEESACLPVNSIGLGLPLRHCPNLKVLDAINHEIFADFFLDEPCKWAVQCALFYDPHVECGTQAKIKQFSLSLFSSYFTHQQKWRKIVCEPNA